MSIWVDEIRNRIIEVASEFFAIFGFKKTTMDDIAKKIHKAKGSIYYYFRSKEDLYREVIQKELKEVENKLSVIVNNESLSSYEKIEMYFKNRVKLLSEAKNYHEILRADFIERYHFVDDVRNDFEKFELQAIEKIIIEIIDNDYIQISDPKLVAKFLLLLLKSSEASLYLQNRYEEYKNVIDELITVVIKGLMLNK